MRREGTGVLYNNYKVGWVRDCVTREDDWEESWCGVVAELLMSAEGPSHSTRLLLEGGAPYVECGVASVLIIIYQSKTPKVHTVK